MKKTYTYQGKELSRKEFIEAKAKEYTRKYKGVDVPTHHVKALLEIAEANEDLAEDSAKEHLEILDDLKKSIQEESPEPIEEESKESQILNLALSNEVNVQEIDSKFKVTATGVEILDASAGEIGNKLRRMLEVNEFSMWAIGDLGNALQDLGGENIIDNMCAKTQLSPSRVYRHMATARAIPREKRTVNVLPSVVEEIVAPRLSDDAKEDARLKEELLKQAQEEKWDTKEARSHANAARVVPKQNKGPKATGRYLVIDHNKKLISLTIELESPDYQDGVIVVDIKEKKTLINDGWIDIPVQNGQDQTAASNQ